MIGSCIIGVILKPLLLWKTQLGEIIFEEVSSFLFNYIWFYKISQHKFYTYFKLRYSCKIDFTMQCGTSLLHDHNSPISLLLGHKYDNQKILSIQISWLYYFIVIILKVFSGNKNDKKEYSFKKNFTPYWWIMSRCNHRHTLIILKYFWLKNTSCTWVSPLFL